MGKGKGREDVTGLEDVDWTRQFDQLDLESKTEADIAAAGLESEDELSRQFEELWKEKSGMALRLRESGGSLQEAALAYEASVQRDSHALDAEAWMFLGQIQAENEKETAAIRALERAIELDDACLPAYTSLAVSYVNEGYDQQAYATLESWIRHRFPDIPIPDGAVAPMDLRARVIDAYLTAARQGPQSPEGGSVDADVQLGLGVLLYGGGEFDKAVDCFVAALEVRPEDYLLWNRLGATLANSGRSEEAINAYHRALDLRPSFVRARYNLGVSCINIGCHREAAEHFLGALSMHGDGQTAVNVSNSLWETLRRVFYMMERRDLAEMAHPGADIKEFRQEFDF
ncbi:hypothetical protein BJ684DRAFT_22632 [Piptocephalis cylindrospora]|uniref:Uncharacterized protein n=1 Tax=Piptocephalis cylindrospora TaxID=1907219 RepID=A0A4P9Y500_9FUNG|nr:hypothetical protein BJ684DRAFT_22632 [Piptocephalis cylindrospora]|eukprot:RKP14066.1 hypothetical protein BJ684DRAFT_22632 [Piptocephalis cylindrospora]